jgi:hypothetical protein
MAEIILLVFEGERTEPQISKSLEKHYFSKTQQTIIRATFKADIYQLFKQIKDDSYLDLVELLREKNDKALDGISRTDVAQVFLFFDYDGHATQASDEAINAMLAYFTNETDNGKLYISYPMVEALKHIQTGVDFKDTVFNATETGYKTLVDRETRYLHIKKFTVDDWNKIILENLKKANFIVNSECEFPSYAQLASINQAPIFNAQLKKYIEPNGNVAVLSAFPFFVIEYFGEAGLTKLSQWNEAMTSPLKQRILL